MVNEESLSYNRAIIIGNYNSINNEMFACMNIYRNSWYKWLKMKIQDEFTKMTIT